MVYPNTFKASVYVILERDGMTPVFLRKNTKWMKGFYTIPAGKAEPQEGLMASAIRETEEEIGIKLDPNDLELVHTQYKDHGRENDIWIGCYFKAKKWVGEPANMEPDLHGDVEWRSYDDLPEPMVPYIKLALDAWRAGKAYSEYKEEAR